MLTTGDNPNRSNRRELRGYKGRARRGGGRNDPPSKSNNGGGDRAGEALRASEAPKRKQISEAEFAAAKIEARNLQRRILQGDF